jgi:hypothetical protein
MDGPLLTHLTPAISCPCAHAPTRLPLPPCSFVYLFCGLGYFSCYTPQQMLPAIAAICAACTVVESLPVNNVVDDNLSVPGVALGLSVLLMPMAAAAVAVAAAAAGGETPMPAAAFGWLSG